MRDLREGGAGALPERVADVVARRVDRLGEDAAGVLETAALLGAEFGPRLLEELHGAGAAVEAIDRARAAGLLVETAPAGARHAFTHALVAEALLVAHLAPAPRAPARAASATCSRARAEADPDRHAAEAARHLVAAGRDPEPRGALVDGRRAAGDVAAGRRRGGRATGATPSRPCPAATPAAATRSSPSARRSRAPAPAARRRGRSTRPRRRPRGAATAP